MIDVFVFIFVILNLFQDLLQVIQEMLNQVANDIIPVQTGIQCFINGMDPRFRGDDVNYIMNLSF